MTPHRKATQAEVARTRILWATNKPTEATAAPAYVPDPPATWAVALAVFVALLVQSTLEPYIALRGAAPSLVTLVVTWYGVRMGSLRGLACGLAAGACEDALAGLTGCAWTFATGIAGTIAGRLSRTWLADTKLVLVPFAGAITLVRFLAFAILMQAQGRALALPLLHLREAILQSIIDALLALVVLVAIPRLGGLAAHRR
jgi:rod shape-determining protein MreD